MTIVHRPGTGLWTSRAIATVGDVGLGGGLPRALGLDAVSAFFGCTLLRLRREPPLRLSGLCLGALGLDGACASAAAAFGGRGLLGLAVPSSSSGEIAALGHDLDARGDRDLR